MSKRQNWQTQDTERAEKITESIDSIVTEMIESCEKEDIKPSLALMRVLAVLEMGFGNSVGRLLHNVAEGSDDLNDALVAGYTLTNSLGYTLAESIRDSFGYSEDDVTDIIERHGATVN